jgi:hypothetical protein
VIVVSTITMTTPVAMICWGVKVSNVITILLVDNGLRDHLWFLNPLSKGAPTAPENQRGRLLLYEPSLRKKLLTPPFSCEVKLSHITPRKHSLLTATTL